MCGIYLEEILSGDGVSCEINFHKAYLKNRGPDFDASFKDSKVFMYSSVLSIIKPLGKQPLIGNRYVVQWNGEIYSPGPLVTIGMGINDGQALLKAIEKWGPLPVLSSIIDAEFAITIYDIEEGIIYYGRDPLGRRSLLVNKDNGRFYISSVALPSLPSGGGGGGGGWVEVGAGGLLFKRYLSSTKRQDEEAVIYFNFYEKLFPPLNCDFEIKTFKELFRLSLWERVESEVGGGAAGAAGAGLISILFSGGVDSLLIAIELLAMIKERDIDLKVELINCSFKGEVSPDRVRGREVFKILEKEHPLLVTFVEVDVTTEEYLLHRDRIIDLSYPKTTVMDISIAAPIYFASKASRSRVNLLGMGADEQLAGYSSHRKAFSINGFQGVQEEIKRQIEEIHHRNLGRDDRIIGDLGKEGRFPFLSIPFLQFLSSIPVEEKYSKEMDKKILRERLQEFSFLPKKFALMPKQAIQFGARSSNIEGGGAGGGGNIEIMK